MSVVRIPTNFNIDLDFEVPEFYRRMLAWLLDVLLLFFYYRIAEAIFSSIVRNSAGGGYDAVYDLNAVALILWLPIYIYHPVCEITMNGRSVGKRIMGLQVVNETGGRPSISQFLIRWLIRTADITVVMILLMNALIFVNTTYIWALIGSILLLITDIVLIVTTKKAQRLGDILAKTILIRTHARGSIEDTVFMPVADNYVPAFPQIMQLSDKDINAIKNILETARKKDDFYMAHTASEKIKAHLRIESSLSPYDFLDVLLKDYNYLSVK